MTRNTARSLAAILLISFAATDRANAMFDMFKLCLFSAITGVILDHGRPVPGARIVRAYEPGGPDSKVSDETVTDRDGRFSLPAVFQRSVILSLLPHEPLVRQSISIISEGREYKAWATYKRSYEENSEAGGKPVVVVCRLENELKRRGEIFGICELS